MSQRADKRGLIVPCPSCGQSRRILFEHLGKHMRCSKCQESLPPPAAAVAIPSIDVLDALLSHAQVPILLDCWAPWCGPCLAIAGDVERIAARRRGDWIVAKVDLDQLPDVAAQLGIQAIPSFVLFSEGKEIERVTGAHPAARIEGFFEDALGKGRSSLAS